MKRLVPAIFSVMVVLALPLTAAGGGDTANPAEMTNDELMEVIKHGNDRASTLAAVEEMLTRDLDAEQTAEVKLMRATIHDHSLKERPQAEEEFNEILEQYPETRHAIDIAMHLANRYNNTAAIDIEKAEKYYKWAI